MPQTVNTMENLEKEAIIELKYSLHEIGLTSTSSEHVTFIKRAVRECVACMSESAEPINFDALMVHKFPRTYKDAYEHVLRHDGYPDRVLYTYTDALNLNDIYPMPYLRQRNLHTGVVYDYRKRDDYKRFTSGQLDPMNRWKSNLISFEELLFVRWFVDDDYASRIGILVEALVACHALYCEACYKCKFRKSLRWNGGASSSWQDMICTNCGKMSLAKKTKYMLPYLLTTLALFPCCNHIYLHPRRCHVRS